MTHALENVEQIQQQAEFPVKQVHTETVLALHEVEAAQLETDIRDKHMETGPKLRLKQRVEVIGGQESFTARFSDATQDRLLLTGGTTGTQVPLQLKRYATFYAPIMKVGGSVKQDIFVEGKKATLTIKNVSDELQISLDFTCGGTVKLPVERVQNFAGDIQQLPIEQRMRLGSSVISGYDTTLYTGNDLNKLAHDSKIPDSWSFVYNEDAKIFALERDRWGPFNESLLHINPYAMQLGVWYSLQDTYFKKPIRAMLQLDKNGVLGLRIDPSDALLKAYGGEKDKRPTPKPGESKKPSDEHEHDDEGDDHDHDHDHEDEYEDEPMVDLPILNVEETAPPKFREKDVRQYHQTMIVNPPELQNDMRIKYAGKGLFQVQYDNIMWQNVGNHFRLSDLSNDGYTLKGVYGGYFGVGGQEIEMKVQAKWERGVLRFYLGVDEIVVDDDPDEEPDTGREEGEYVDNARDRGDLYFPVKGTVSSVDYAHTHSGNRKFAIDVAAPQGTEIVSVGDGLVVHTEDGIRNKRNPKGSVGSGYGNQIYIRHNNGTYSFYGHMSPGLAVKENQRVSAGQKLGGVGNTGHVISSNGGYHLHFELWKLKPGHTKEYTPQDGDFETRRGKHLQKVLVDSYTKRRSKKLNTERLPSHDLGTATKLDKFDNISEPTKTWVSSRKLLKGPEKNICRLYFWDFRNDAAVQRCGSIDRPYEYVSLNMDKATVEKNGTKNRSITSYGKKWKISLLNGNRTASPETGKAFQEGSASYHDNFINKGFDSNKHFVAAHNTLPNGTTVKVTNLTNNQTTNVKIVSTGPFVKISAEEASRLGVDGKTAPLRLIDLSGAACKAIGMVDGSGNPNGTAKVKIEIVS